MCLPSFPFIYVIWHLSSVRHRVKCNRREREKTQRHWNCSLHVLIGDAHMSGRDSIVGPETMQLPASAFSHLSGKSFSSLVPVLTDENHFQSLLFLISISFNYCSSTMPFTLLSFLPSHSKCNGPLANNIGKQWALNCEILFLHNSLFFSESLFISH